MNKSWLGFLLRFTVIFIFHLLFKQNDNSFDGAFEPGTRSLVFSIYFIVYWLLFWELCSFIYKKLILFSSDKRTWYRRLALITSILLIMVIAGSLIFNKGYFIIDHFVFGIGADTEDISYLNPELFKPSRIFSTIHINPELLFGFLLLFILVYGTHIFITSVKNTKELELIAARKTKESIAAQYEALKNQIDPHFFFNSLSVLSSLIFENTELSASYISHLSKHYRYILETPADRLVSVENELRHLESYFYLIEIRHPECISLSVNLLPSTQIDIRILPHSLLMLVENAVKHNIFRKDCKLNIEISEDADYIIISNNINKRYPLQKSTGIGLQNIRTRYAIESRKEIVIDESEKYFIVKLPKIK